jgi:peptidoglycan/LPS O-acetylase OafA/YrhL
MFSSDTTIYKFDIYSIFNAMEVTGIFLLFRNIKGVNLHGVILTTAEKIFRKAAFSLAKYSYGFYLIHQAIMDIFIKILKHFDMFTGYKSLFVLLFVVTLGVSWILMAGLDRIPYVNKVIGSK